MFVRANRARSLASMTIDTVVKALQVFPAVTESVFLIHDIIHEHPSVVLNCSLLNRKVSGPSKDDLAMLLHLASAFSVVRRGLQVCNHSKADFEIIWPAGDT